MSQVADGERAPPRSFRAWLAAMPRWKKVLVGCALGSVTIGGALWLAHGAPAAPAGTGPPPAGGAAAAFLPGGGQPGAGNPGTGAPGGSAAAAGEPAAKGVFRLGSSFLVGFCVGAFVRAAVKMAAVAFGFFLVALFLLDQGGFVVVDWNAIDQAWSGFWARVGEEWSDFQRFMTGRLPAAGLASLGLYAGFRRH